MGTLASELSPHVDRAALEPRVYVDANVPRRLVHAMRGRLKWDVLFVMEHDDLRRARDGEHFRLARQLRRTLITLDRDYLDDRRFPAAESGGVVVLSAPARRRPAADPAPRSIASCCARAPTPTTPSLPLEGRKLHLHVDWAGMGANA